MHIDIFPQYAFFRTRRTRCAHQYAPGVKSGDAKPGYLNTEQYIYNLFQQGLDLMDGSCDEIKFIQALLG